DGDRAAADPGEVVLVVAVALAEVVADRRPVLAEEDTATDERAGRALVEVDAHVRRSEVAVLDQIAAAGGFLAGRDVRPFGVHAAADARADSQALEGRARRVVLDVDADGYAVDRRVDDVRAVRRGSGPDAG